MFSTSDRTKIKSNTTKRSNSIKKKAFSLKGFKSIGKKNKGEFPSAYDNIDNNTEDKSSSPMKQLKKSLSSSKKKIQRDVERAKSVPSSLKLQKRSSSVMKRMKKSFSSSTNKKKQRNEVPSQSNNDMNALD